MPSISANGVKGPVSVDVLTLDNGQAFINMRVSPDMSVILDDFDHHAAQQARELAAGLLKAAEAIEASRPLPDPVDAIEPRELVPGDFKDLTL